MKLNFMDVNCSRCGDGPEGKVTSTEAVDFAEEHGQEAHGEPTVGLSVNQRSS